MLMMIKIYIENKCTQAYLSCTSQQWLICTVEHFTFPQREIFNNIQSPNSQQYRIVCDYSSKYCNVPAVSRKRFGSANCHPIYTIHLSLCTQTADLNPFRGTHCSSRYWTICHCNVLQYAVLYWPKAVTLVVRSVPLHVQDVVDPPTPRVGVRVRLRLNKKCNKIKTNQNNLEKSLKSKCWARTYIKKVILHEV